MKQSRSCEIFINTSAFCKTTYSKSSASDVSSECSSTSFPCVSTIGDLCRNVFSSSLVLLVDHWFYLYFLSLRTFRQSSCAFYLTIMSVVNTIQMFTGLLTFIMINGFGINWLNMSIVYCKIRAFYIQLCILISMTCMCLGVIDQFLATCSNPRWHQWNNIKVARYMIIGTVILTVLHGIPYLMYYNHTLSSLTGGISCAITNTIFQKYFTAILQSYFRICSTNHNDDHIWTFGVSQCTTNLLSNGSTSSTRIG